MTETTGFTPDIEAVAQRVKQTSDRVLELSKENGSGLARGLREDAQRRAEARARDGEGPGSGLGHHAGVDTDRCRAGNVRAFLGAMKDRLK